eukprot:CAMPEP_0185711860 /NCGR_PEP_ID=MMETSP1164-20130828/33623_1 /TAXON_ID=1104430 /ORGANISM="Chrysoreinhardia sp, Strain CCMP2950" /LENGTH=160 /DNA_ID=CAMNT_0028379403 /DNA_START=1 /DNA_END=479 /DNA_ORIENTATION=+
MSTQLAGAGPEAAAATPSKRKTEAPVARVVTPVSEHRGVSAAAKKRRTEAASPNKVNEEAPAAATTTTMCPVCLEATGPEHPGFALASCACRAHRACLERACAAADAAGATSISCPTCRAPLDDADVAALSNDPRVLAALRARRASAATDALVARGGGAR